jgi:hypothetical protein
MTAKATETYVTEVLALQGVAVTSEAAKAIAPTLSAQLDAAAPAYASLAFETEPTGFLVVQARESA